MYYNSAALVFNYNNSSGNLKLNVQNRFLTTLKPDVVE